MLGLRGRALLLVVVGATLLALPSCEAQAGSEKRASSIVAQYLTALSGEDGDRGWELLHPTTRANMFGNDRDTYIRLATAAGPDEFVWSIDHVLRDDDQLYRVFITLPVGSHPPSVLTTPKDHLVLLGVSESAAEIPVRFGSGGDGIWAIGG